MIYLIANWKMNPASQAEAQKLTKEVVSGFKKLKTKKTKIIFCPPFPYLPELSKHISASKSKNISLGAQNSYFVNSGAYTGEVSPKMLKDLKCDYVILGHSERRGYFKEDSEIINKKIKAVLKNKMTPILAIGEKQGESLLVVKKQLLDSLKGVAAAQVKKMIIAYEPVWAIGTGKAEDPDGAMTAKLFIQKILSDKYSKKTAETVQIIYGGSTNSKNIKPYITEAGMAGALVGGASLKPKEFLKMIENINENS